MQYSQLYATVLVANPFESGSLNSLAGLATAHATHFNDEPRAGSPTMTSLEISKTL